MPLALGLDSRGQCPFLVLGTTAATSRYEGSFIIALLEGRGVSREVGIAALDRDTGRVMLIQLADCQTYVKTLHQMHLHYPTLVLVPDTFLSPKDSLGPSPRNKTNHTSLLVQRLCDEFPGVPMEPVLRKFWNEDAGLEFVSQLCVQDEERTAMILAFQENTTPCPLPRHYLNTQKLIKYAIRYGSLRIRYVPVDGTMLIDPETVRNLEIIGNMGNAKSPHSLLVLRFLSVLNHCSTAMARRLLRASLLAQANALKHLCKVDLDKLISALASNEAREASSARTASSRVTQMLNLRGVVRHLPALEKALIGSKSELLCIICDMLSDERLNEGASPQKTGIAAVNARVYAVKANFNPLLDVARGTYKENVGDIHALHESIQEKNELPIQLVYQESGFLFSVKKADLDEGGKWLFTSMELKKRNARMKDSLEEALILSHSTIKDLVTEILLNIAMLDMVWSFAQSPSSTFNHPFLARPEFTENVQSVGTLVPNDVYCSDSTAFQMLHGPNTYLKQVGLLTIMAQCGCFVPAEYASFRIHAHLLTRLSNDDDIEKSLSTFANEMASSAMILGLASSESLVIIDELGRATSPKEGVGISHAIAEELIKLKCFTLFATHFHELSVTLSRQPTVVQIVNGPADEVEHYGSVSTLSGLAEDVLVEAEKVAQYLSDGSMLRDENSESSKVAKRRKAVLKLRTTLNQAFEHSRLPDRDFLAYLTHLQEKLTKELASTLSRDV
ncbi:muts domain V-domain-containing protein [Lactarius quietus]|nr:muts domain V-domain-containing protein [Lactarius quietus]